MISTMAPERPCDSPDDCQPLPTMAERLAAMGSSRALLAAIELGEVRDVAVRLLMLVMGTGVLLLLAGLGMVVVAVMVLETTATLAVVAGMTVVYAVVAWLVYRKIVRLVRSGGWFAESRAQCRKDAMWISQMNL
jgi:uncharacterized membrane protein YqjE